MEKVSVSAGVEYSCTARLRIIKGDVILSVVQVPDRIYSIVSAGLGEIFLHMNGMEFGDGEACIAVSESRGSCAEFYVDGISFYIGPGQ